MQGDVSTSASRRVTCLAGRNRETHNETETRERQPAETARQPLASLPYGTWWQTHSLGSRRQAATSTWASPRMR